MALSLAVVSCNLWVSCFYPETEMWAAECSQLLWIAPSLILRNNNTFEQDEATSTEADRKEASSFRKQITRRFQLAEDKSEAGRSI